MANSQNSRRNRSKRIIEKRREYNRNYRKKNKNKHNKMIKEYKKNILVKERGITNQYRYFINKELTKIQMEMSPQELIDYVKNKEGLIK
jgi:hypothetical protein